MTAPLHDRLVAALDATQHDADTAIYRATTLGDKIRRRVRHQRNVLARHAPIEGTERCGWCWHPGSARRDQQDTDLWFWPCPDVRDLAGMLDVEVTP